jgi:DNA-directed RNA polymerase subunit RPC12/RpoP
MRETIPSRVRIKCDTCGKEVDQAVALIITEPEPNQNPSATRTLDLCLRCWNNVEAIMDRMKMNPLEKRP